MKLHIISLAAVMLLTLSLGAKAHSGQTEVELLVLPSGLETTLQERVTDETGAGPVHRFRFVAPDFTGAVDLETVTADLEFLCNGYALETLSAEGAEAGQIIISLADKPSEFGIYDPDITQVFEAYRVENGLCIWEIF